MLESSQRAQLQTAYQVQVASTVDKLLAGAPDVWDPGKVASAESVNVAYQGPPLESRARYFWRVRAWDKNGEPSPWGQPAWWEMGLLDESDW